MSVHHPSCRENDKDLVWLCAQCGGHESAEKIESELHKLRQDVEIYRSNCVFWKEAAAKLRAENVKLCQTLEQVKELANLR